MAPSPAPDNSLLVKDIKEDELAFVGCALALAAGLIGSPKPIDGIIHISKDQACVVYDGLQRAMKVIDGIKV